MISRAPVRSGVEVVDRVLRGVGERLGPRVADLPLLLLVRYLGDLVEIVFDGPARPPDGVVSVDETTWAVPVGDLQVSEHAAAPFPTLTAIGTGCYGHMLLLNLAAARPALLIGDSEYPAQVLRAIALDLARSPWAEAVRVHLVGFGADLHQIRPDRFSYYEQPTTCAETVAKVCSAEATPDPANAVRQRSRASHIVLCSHAVDGHRQVLAGLLRAQLEVCAVAVTAEPAPADARVDATDTPVTLNCDQCRLAMRDMSWYLNPRRVSAGDFPYAVASLPMPTIGRESTPGVSSSPRSRPAPVRDETPRLEIRVLGKPMIERFDIREFEPARVSQTTQLLVFLALHPNATIEKVSRTICPDAPDPHAECRARISRARHLIGEHHLPKATNHMYNLLGYRLDAAEFYRLVQRSKARPDHRAAADLEDALAHVYGRPFDDTSKGRYDWAASWAEQYLLDIIQASHRLADLYRAMGWARGARDAARKALSLSPRSATAAADLFHALYDLGERDQLHRALDHYQQACSVRSERPDPNVTELAHDLLFTRKTR